MLALALVAVPPRPPIRQVQLAVTGDGSSTPIAELPFIDATSNAQLLGELLARPTGLGETTALQVRLPPPQHPELASSLVRVIGEADSPHVVFRSDALARLGAIGKSPGPDFFTAFVTLSPAELDRLQARGRPESRPERSAGRPASRCCSAAAPRSRAPTSRPSTRLSSWPASPSPINHCSVLPMSTLQAWGQALFITAPDVVLDPARTWDPCTGAGTQGGVWTFAHLMREMANGSGKTPEDFVKDWLSLWLNNYTVNGDTVLARTQMFNQVIQPWATASGVTATLVTNPFTGVRRASISAGRST